MGLAGCKRKRGTAQHYITTSVPVKKYSPLCGPCDTGLPLNDSRFGGYVKTFGRSQIVLRKSTRQDNNLRLKLCYARCDDLPDLPNLLESAISGCHFCGLLRGAVRARNLTTSGPVQFSFEYQWEQKSVGDMAIDGLNAFLVTMNVTSRHTEDMRKHYFVFTLETTRGNPCADYLGLRYLPEKNALCPKNVSMIRTVLKNSVVQCCPKNVAFSFVPRRLLELSITDAHAPRLVQLGDASIKNSELEPSPNIEYAALSYCWGSSEASEQLLMNSNSLDTMRQEIPMEKMPNTLQDAVKVCRALSIRYLWVDRLCIMQDNHVEWEAESARMGEIYENAIITICALAPSSCADGFLKRSPQTVEIPFRSSLDTRVSGSYTLTYRSKWHQARIPRENYGLVQYDYNDSAWTKRGWTCQEEHMSKRLLYVGESRLHFACDHQVWTENNLQKGRETYRKVLLRFPVSNELRADFTDCRRSLYDIWYRFASRFNARTLSRPSDKFPALCGLARRMGEMLNDTYMAGLWKGNLHTGLLWFSLSERGWRDYHNTLMSPSEFAAPSWSWASQPKWFSCGTSHFIVNEENIFNPEFDLLNYDVSLAGTSPFGAFHYANLLLSGVLISCPPKIYSSSKQERRPGWNMIFEDQVTYTCELDWLADFDEEVALPLGMKMFKLGRCTSYVRKGKPTGREIVWGLLLLPIGKSPRHEYWRVGVFSSHQGFTTSPDPFDGCEPTQICLV